MAILNDTQDVIMHVGPIAGCNPTPLFLFGLFWFLLCGFLFVCLFASFFGLFCLMGLLTGLCIGPLPALLRLSTNWPCMLIYTSSFLLRLNVCNDLAKAMKALDGQKTQE